MIFCANASTGTVISVMYHLQCYLNLAMQMLMSGHNQISHVVPRFSHHDLWNVMMPLMTPAASLDAYASVNSKKAML